MPSEATTFIFDLADIGDVNGRNGDYIPFGRLLLYHVSKTHGRMSDFASEVGWSVSFLSQVCTGQRVVPVHALSKWAASLKLRGKYRWRFLLLGHMTSASPPLQALIKDLLHLELFDESVWAIVKRFNQIHNQSN